MTVVGMKKYLFVGLQKDRDVFFERAQKKGCLEFISSQRKVGITASERVLLFIQALKLLKRQVVKKEIESPKDLDPEAFSTLIVECGASLEKLEEKKRGLKQEIRKIEPLGEFDLEDVREIERETGRFIQFFCMKKEKLHLMKDQEREVLIPIGSGQGMDYFMAVSTSPQHFSELIELRLKHSLKELHADLEKVRGAIREHRHTLQERAGYIEWLEDHLTHALNRSNLIHAKKDVASHLDGALFAIEAWVPEPRLHTLFPLLEGIGVHAEEVAIQKGERVPTYLENQNYGKLGEDLVQIYDIPGNEDKDPSTWVFWAFAVFFAMIISDAGYGVIFLIVSLILRRKYRNIQSSGKRFLKLFTVLSAFCIGWGVFSGSYFGIELPLESPLNRINFIQALAVKKADYHLKQRDQTFENIVKEFPKLAKEVNGKTLLSEAKVEKNGRLKYVVSEEFRDSVLMEIALMTGVIHISLSLLRQLSRAFSGIGWVIAMVGAYLYLPKILQTTSIVHFAFFVPKEIGYEWGGQLFWGGISLALLASLIQNKWKGVVDCIKVIELFADVLSYLRLYALGLAAMILAGTFNQIGMKFGFVVGFFITLIGHAVNISVGLMGGVIHGLRLNFIEWYHHSFEGGGKLFNPLKLIKPRGE